MAGKLNYIFVQMKKLKYIPKYLITVLLSLLVAFSSCTDENPVIQNDGPYQFDSARYTWTTDTILNQYSGLVFGLDTSHVYIIGTHSLTFYDGNNYTHHPYGDLYFNAIDGFDPMHIYIAGAYPNGDNRLMKWDGSVYQDIPVPGDTSLSGGLTTVYAKSANEIWFSTIGKIFLSNGSTWTEYEIDSAVGIISFAEFNGNLIAIGRRSYGSINSDLEINVYQYENESWPRIFHNITHYYEKPIIPVKLGNKLYGCLEGLLKFDGSDFYKILESPTGYNMGYTVAGESDDNFLTLITSEHEVFYVNWNGNKWSREIYVVSTENMKKIGSNYYILESPCSSCNFVLLRIGKPNF